jgi:hypothetical protein
MCHWPVLRGHESFALARKPVTINLRRTDHAVDEYDITLETRHKIFRALCPENPTHIHLHKHNMAGLLFVTALEADFKIINHALLYMRDWEESNGELDVLRLVTDRTGTQNHQDGTPLPLKSLPENVWTGATLEDVETYCLSLDCGDDEHPGASLFVVIDSEGLKNRTCVLASMPDEHYETPGTFRGRYDKIRLPWDEFYAVWCNLDISNMNFEEFVEEESGDGHGWYTYQSIIEDDDYHNAGLARKNKSLGDWRQQGYI